MQEHGSVEANNIEEPAKSKEPAMQSGVASAPKPRVEASQRRRSPKGQSSKNPGNSLRMKINKLLGECTEQVALILELTGQT